MNIGKLLENHNRLDESKDKNTVVRLQTFSKSINIWCYHVIEDPSNIGEIAKEAEKITEKMDWLLDRMERELKKKREDYRFERKKLKAEDWTVDKLKSKKLITFYYLARIESSNETMIELIHTDLMLFIMDSDYKYDDKEPKF